MAACVSCFNNDDDVVPWTEVNIKINPNSAKYIDLLSPLECILIEEEGYKKNGIIVFHTPKDDFAAFDCTCTYELSDTAAVRLNESRIGSVICPVCGSIYSLIDNGMPTSGKARYSLKSYRVSYNEPYLRIFN
ncbi:MAG: hypothetical protein IKR52_04280 [Paludibacteraceae bacterium]|nr:hypothetical protein [Paludibacteraceae bacterium]